jgi:hypothetical protein
MRSLYYTIRGWGSKGGRAGEKTSQWSGGTVLLRGGVITSHWLG